MHPRTDPIRERRRAGEPLECSKKGGARAESAPVGDRVHQQVCVGEQAFRTFDLPSPEIAARLFTHHTIEELAEIASVQTQADGELLHLRWTFPSETVRNVTVGEASEMTRGCSSHAKDYRRVYHLWLTASVPFESFEGAVRGRRARCQAFVLWSRVTN